MMRLVLAILLVAIAATASAQIDLSGEWAPRFYEDQPERVPGPDLGDYLGIPISDAARWRAEAWSASIMTLPEWQCRPHSADYIWRGPSPVRITKEVDPISREITAFHAEWLRSIDRPIYLDGRPHPSPNAPHTWAGFSTGKWNGDVLTVTTTHLKEGYLRRNGLPRSDKAKLTEHFIRNNDVLTVMTIIEDPVYLTEPFVRTTDYELDLKQRNPPYPCHVVEEIDRPKGTVPHVTPGTSESSSEFAKKHQLPPEAVRGGAATMFPASARGVTIAKAGAPAALKPGVPIDLTGQWVSVVTEDWRWRMVTPPRGDYASVPLSPEGVKVVNAWDPARDEAAGEQCRAYGAGGIMRMPGQVRISWQNDNTLKIETEAGAQTRLFQFTSGGGANEPSWQGVSTAAWQYAGPVRRGGGPRPPGGSLRVTTTHLRPGYLRKNGVPYGANARVTEFFNRFDEPNGDSWLVVTTLVEDPQYLAQRFITSSHFKKVADGAPWIPTGCAAK